MHAWDEEEERIGGRDRGSPASSGAEDDEMGEARGRSRAHRMSHSGSEGEGAGQQQQQPQVHAMDAEALMQRRGGF